MVEGIISQGKNEGESFELDPNKPSNTQRGGRAVLLGKLAECIPSDVFLFFPPSLPTDTLLIHQSRDEQRGARGSWSDRVREGWRERARERERGREREKACLSIKRASWWTRGDASTLSSVVMWWCHPPPPLFPLFPTCPFRNDPYLLSHLLIGAVKKQADWREISSMVERYLKLAWSDSD